MTPESEALHQTLIAAFPRYVRERVRERGLPQVDAAVDEATEWLDEHLGALLEVPPRDQMHSPLEIVREALRIPTAALELLGAQTADRDEVVGDLLPADPYGLVPASAQELSEAAWQAHLAWGVAKAGEVAGMIPAASRPTGPSSRPTIAIVSTNLMDRTKLTSVIEGAGFRAVVVRNPGAIVEHLSAGDRPSLAFVDLDHGGADEAIRRFSADAVKVVAYGPHVDDVAMVRARSLGASDAVARSRLFRDPASYLPALA